jgi:hypothetical protein
LKRPLDRRFFLSGKANFPSGKDQHLLGKSVSLWNVSLVFNDLFDGMKESPCHAAGMFGSIKT